MTEPNTLLEDRLTAALAARALQVDEHDLVPAELPQPHRRNRRPLVLAAAACTALVIGVPYGIAQLDGTGTPPAPPATAPTSPTLSADGEDWPISGTSKVDLDGDGTKDSVRLRIGPAAGLGAESPLQARIEVDLANGTVFTIISEGTEYHLEGSADLPGQGGGESGEELLLSVGTSLRVFGLVDGHLQELKAPAEPPLVQRVDSQGRLVSWAVEDGELFTLRSIDPIADRPKFAVDRWQWRIADGVLVARQVGGGCVVATSPLRLVDCSPSVPARLTPEQPTGVRIGTEAGLPFALDGEPARARLVLTDPNYPGGDGFNEGEVKLVVKAGTRTWQFDLAAGGIPELFTADVVVSRTDGNHANFVVGRFTNIDVHWEVFTFIDDELVQLTTPGTGPTLGTTYDFTNYRFPPNDLPTASSAWVQGSWLYSWFGDGTEKQAYRWEQTGRALNPVPLGTYCPGTDGLRSC